MLKINDSKPIISRDAALAILDRLDGMRRSNHANKNNRGYEDINLRLACAIVANAGGIKTRTEWEDALRNTPDSEYAQDYSDPEFANAF